MTSRRPPLTTSEGLARIAGHLPGGYAEMAEVVGRSTAQVYAWGNPNTDDDIPWGCAKLLDRHYRSKGGPGYPLLETYAAQLEYEDGQRFARQIELSLHLIEVLRENSEAEIAIAEAARPDANDGVRRKAAAEVRDAMSALRRSLPLLGASGDERHQTGPPAA